MLPMPKFESAKEISDYVDRLYTEFPTLYWSLPGHPIYDVDWWFYFVRSREEMGAYIYPVIYWGA